MGARILKQEVRIAGFDDAPFRFGDEKTELIGVVFRGGAWMEGVLAGMVEVDGTDAGERIAEVAKRFPQGEQLRAIMLDGVTFGGFNVADIGMISRKTGVPVIAVVRERPDLAGMKKAIMRLPDWEERWRKVESSGKLHETGIRHAGKPGTVWFQAAGIDAAGAGALIRLSSTRSLVPEPLRAAHMIASGMKGIKWKAAGKRSSM